MMHVPIRHKPLKSLSAIPHEAIDSEGIPTLFCPEIYHFLWVAAVFMNKKVVSILCYRGNIFRNDMFVCLKVWSSVIVSYSLHFAVGAPHMFDENITCQTLRNVYKKLKTDVGCLDVEIFAMWIVYKRSFTQHRCFEVAAEVLNMSNLANA